MAKISIIGAGAFSLALAVMADKFGHEVTVWTAFEEELTEISETRQNSKKLPDITLSETINFTSALGSIEGAELIIFGVPSNVTRAVAKLVKEFIPKNAIIVNTSKGIEAETHKRMSQVISEVIPDIPVVALSGPSHAEEVARDVPTTVVVASENSDAAKKVQSLLSNRQFRIYRNHDVIGCEIGGALKNIIAIGAGICDGLEFGDNTKAALITRGIAEMTRLGNAMGARHETFAGLTGLGDVNVTCYSVHSRNRRAGILIGSGLSPAEAIEKIGTVEGFHCCKVIRELTKKYNVSMPISEQLYEVLFNNLPPKAALEKLMTRPLTDNESDYLEAYR